MKKTILILQLLISVFATNVVLADDTYYLVHHAEKQKDGSETRI